ncbi:ABC transporter ATP-binding protein/permease, partial [Candidatus Pelagibacter sp.]|nr:ABC transporter ATP-binding protein/permease [Candidatus Pelagibacter sp.]
FMMLIMALLDMIGVASILPFIAVLTNPSLIDTNLILNNIFQVSTIFGVESYQEFLFVLGIIVFVTLVISIIFKALTTYAQVRFVQMREYSISKRLVEGYLRQPYSWFLSRNSSELGKTILSEVGQVIALGMRPMLEVIAKAMVTIALITLLIIADPNLAMIVSVFLGGTYLFIFYFIRKYINRIGNERLKKNESRFKTIGEAFGAVKEVKVGGLEQVYSKQFSDSALTFAQTQASAQVITHLPRFILEAIAFGGILLIILFVMAQSGNFNDALPILSLYVFAGYRLMPALQQIYASCTAISFLSPSLNKLYSDLKENNIGALNENQDQGILSLNKKISLRNIKYNYPNTSRAAIKDVSLDIPAKATIGLVGATGSGKTTTVDIILGLLEPQKGTLEVDSQIITNQNSRSWQRSIGYVPQYIYLSDDTIEGNIAFGIDPKDIDKEAVEKASKIANLHNFVIDELPQNYQTTVGERGVRLSGGQRQRIGIARALYHNPQLLILDEATSALDNETEQAVMDAVNNLSQNMTIILIAHRLNTVKNCDIIFKLDDGKLIDQGSFDEIINIKKNFITK